MSKKILFGSGGVAQVPIIDSVIHATDNYLLKLDGDFLKISEDDGLTWPRFLKFTTKLNAIRITHIFSNGIILLGDHKKLAYTDVNFSVFEFSTVRDINGDIFSPVLNYDNFSTVNGTSVQKDADGKEFLMWGNYNNSENNNITYLWWTEDFGENVKCIYQFNISSTENNGVLLARHVHGVTYHQPLNEFIVCVGDEPTTTYSHWVKVIYNKANQNPFSFYHIGSGDKYKSANLVIDSGYVYASLDTAGGGLIRIPYAEMDDVTKFEDIKVGLNDALFIWVKGNEALIVQSRWIGSNDGRYFYYTEDFTNPNLWQFIKGITTPEATENTIHARVFPPNNKGMVLSGLQLNYTQAFHMYNFTPSTWVNKSLEKAGFPNAFK